MRWWRRRALIVLHKQSNAQRNYSLVYTLYLYIQYFKTFENYCYISFDVLRGGGVRKSSKCRNYFARTNRNGLNNEQQT